MGRPTTKHCEVPGCGLATREGKPFCSKHVTQHPYIHALLGQIAEREAEELRVSRWGAPAVDLKGITAQEILTFVVVHGARSVPRLARELNLPRETIEGYARPLASQGAVHLGTTRRGAIMVYPHDTPLERRGTAAA